MVVPFFVSVLSAMKYCPTVKHYCSVLDENRTLMTLILTDTHRQNSENQ